VVPVETAPPEPSAAYENERFKVYPVGAAGVKWSGERIGQTRATP
jgi:hypothetical protein